MGLFGKKTSEDHLKTTLAQLQLRAAALTDKRAVAEAALDAATKARQAHRHDGDLADEKLDAKLQTNVDLCQSRLAGLDADLAALQAKIADTEQQLADERGAAERKAASDRLALDLGAVEKALPVYLDAARQFAASLEAFHFHYEATELSRFIGNCASQAEIAAAFSLQELRGMMNAIATGSGPIPAAKPEAAPIAAPEPAPEVRRLFALRPIKWKDHAGRQQYGQQYEDCELPPATAAKALRCGAVVSLDDARRKQFRGSRGGEHVNPNAIDLLDLDALEGWSGARHASFDPLVSANFVEVTRGPERRGVISVYRI